LCEQLKNLLGCIRLRRVCHEPDIPKKRQIAVSQDSRLKHHAHNLVSFIDDKANNRRKLENGNGEKDG
jgi:N-acetylglutamate synthase-like GNAT family acetyltransferase